MYSMRQKIYYLNKEKYRILALFSKLCVSLPTNKDKLIEPTKGRTKVSTGSSSLRNAFSGNWENDVDSVSYAQMLREESVLNDREIGSW